LADNPCILLSSMACCF